MGKFLIVTAPLVLLSFQSAQADNHLESLGHAISACRAQMTGNTLTKGYKYVTDVYNKITGLAETKTVRLVLNKTFPNRFKIDIFYASNPKPAQSLEFDMNNNERCLLSKIDKKCSQRISENHQNLLRLSGELVQESDEDMVTFNCVLDVVKETDRVANPQLFDDENSDELAGGV